MSTEHLNNDPSPSQNEEWEAAALSFAANPVTQKSPSKPPKKGKSRRTMSVILTSVGTVLLAVVVTIIAIFGNFDPKVPDDSTQTTQSTQNNSDVEQPGITLLDKTGDAEKDIKAAQLTSVSITNKEDGYTISYNNDLKAYVIEGYEDIDLASTLVTTLRAYTETIQATEQVKNAANLAAFGLDKPQATATITYSDKSTATLHVGNLTPSESGYYGQLEGQDGVYIFKKDALAIFRFRSTAFANTQLITTPAVKADDTNATALLKEITYGGTAFPTSLSLRRSTPNDREEMTYFAYLITHPYFRATRDTVSNALGQFKSLSADQALFLHPSKQQKEKLGFNKPLMTLKATMAVEVEKKASSDAETGDVYYYNSTTYNITVGSKDTNGNYIVMVDGIDAIFLVNKDSYGFVFDLTYENAVNEFLFVKRIESVSRVSIRYKGQTHHFDLTHYPDKEEADDKLLVKEGDKVYPTADFRNLYSMMLNLEREDEKITSKPDADVPLEISLYDEDGSLYLSAKYYNASGSLCIVETSEGELFPTRWSFVSFFIQQVDNYLNGKDVLVST